MGSNLSIRKVCSPMLEKRNHRTPLSTKQDGKLSDTNRLKIEARGLNNCEFTWTQLPHYLQQFIIHTHMNNSVNGKELDAFELGKLKELVQHEFEPSECCYICSVYSPQETRQCDMCLQSFHEGCLVVMGQLKTPDEIRRFKRIDEAGWFCCQCDNLADILQQYGASEVLDFLEDIRLDEEVLKSMKNSMVTKKVMNVEHVERKRLSSSRSSRTSSGCEKLHWWEFLRTETVKRLSLSSIKVMTPSRRKKIDCLPSDINLNCSLSNSEFSNGSWVKASALEVQLNGVTFTPVTDLSKDKFDDPFIGQTSSIPSKQSTIYYSGRESQYTESWNFPGAISTSPVVPRKAENDRLIQ